MAVALPKIGFNEGSLLRRTLLHVGTFLVGSVAFIGLVSFVLVTIAKSVVAPKADADDTAAAETASSGSPKVAKPPTVKLPQRGKRPAPATNATPPPAAEE
jgi:hypothetical protein